jgi:tetratricopeptide (TPR) repeat protein
MKTTQVRMLLLVSAGLASVAAAYRFAVNHIPPEGSQGRIALTGQQTASAWPAAASGPAAGLPDPGSAVRAIEISQLRRHLERFPTDFPARFQLAEQHLAQNNHSQALAELEILQRAQPDNAEVYLRRAMVLKYAGELDDAEKAVRRSLALRPQDREAREWLGEIYLGQGRFDEALAVFARCLKRAPDSYFALMGKARALEQKFIWRLPVGLSEMTAPVEKAVRLQPDNPWGVVTLARMTFNYQARPDPAEKLALRAAGLDPRDAEPYLILAEIALYRPATPANLKQAGLYALQAARRDPRDWRPPYQLGRALLKQNEPAEAAKLLEQSVKMQATPEAVYQLSLAYARAGNVVRAKEYGGIYQRWNDFAERRKVLLGEVQREPRQAEHYYRLVDLYLKAGAPDPAENWLRKAQALKKDEPRLDRLMLQVRRLRDTGNDAPLLPVQ